MNVEKMRRYADRGREARIMADADEERDAWLSEMTPEHRAWHESVSTRRGPICPDCVRNALEPLRHLVERKS